MRIIGCASVKDCLFLSIALLSKDFVVLFSTFNFQFSTFSNAPALASSSSAAFGTDTPSWEERVLDAAIFDYED